MNYGNNTNRTIDPRSRQFGALVQKQGRPVVPEDLTFISQIASDRGAQAVRVNAPSGFFIDPTRALADFQFDPLWSNLFKLAPAIDGATEPTLFANVNGWIIPVAGVLNADGLTNNITLHPAPQSDGRVDLVFLEVWEVPIYSNPSTVNKPSASTFYKYGNTEFGGTNLPDDLKTTIGSSLFDTSHRTQLQYRLRVFGSGSSSVNLDTYPDGLGDPNVLAQGAMAAPVAGFIFENMGDALGDAGLWRAGDGNSANGLGTVDGYVYAVPLCAVFRRNSATFLASTASGNPNQNGAKTRTPGTSYLANPRLGARELLQASLAADLNASATGTITITNLDGSGLEDAYLNIATSFLVIDGEIIGMSAVDSGLGTVTIPVGGRGRNGTAAARHSAGASVSLYNTRPDGVFADQVRAEDILDLRHAVTVGEWDFDRLLGSALGSLIAGDLRSTWKRSGAGDCEGPVVVAVDTQLADGATSVPNHTDGLDGPDGIRTVFSDAATIQHDVTLLLDNEAALAGNFTADQFDATTSWEVGADFKPTGFVNQGSVITGSWTNGTVMFFHIGGDDGNEGARGTFRNTGDRAVRFAMPKEMWKTGYPVIDPVNGNQHPITMRFLTERAHEPSPFGEGEDLKHPGPIYPWRNLNFERPFIALGGVAGAGLKVSRAVDTNLLTPPGYDPSPGPSTPITDPEGLVTQEGMFQIDMGVDFDLAGGFYSLDSNGDFEVDPTSVSTPLLRSSTTLYELMTRGGTDRTGAASEIYLVVYGDEDSLNNNGAFRVVGAGTVGYTQYNANNATSVVVVPLNPEFSGFDATGNTVTVEVRTPYSNADDGGSFVGGTPDLCLVLTDLGGALNHPWNRTTLDDLAVPISGVTSRAALESKLEISLSLIYQPNHGAFSRIPDQLLKTEARNTDSSYVRQNPATLDLTFAASTGGPSDETPFPAMNIQTWNRLGSFGWSAPMAPGYGGVQVGNTEQDREAELFVDLGSKTILFRPFRLRAMTLQGQTTAADPSLVGDLTYPDATPKDGGSIFTGGSAGGKLTGFPVPPEYMPRFGRQDIPYTRGNGSILPGINHLFGDNGVATSPVFNVIGGPDNQTGGSQVRTLTMTTGTGTDYAHYGTTIGAINNVPHYGCRKVPLTLNVSDPLAQEVIRNLRRISSSDLIPGLRGIQLPPHLGVARLYGVYDRRDYLTKGGRTFLADRVTLEVDPATNLLREDADKQTLHILRDGALDFTESRGDHTYIIPDHVLDITRSPSYVEGESFDDMEFVVECVVFGFSKDWINGNNYVLCRRHNGSGATLTDGDDPELEGISMILPCAAALNQPLTHTYTRTVYQGDPYMSRAGEVQTTSDYEPRLGAVPVASARQLATPIEQFAVDGSSNIELPNMRGFEILASADFYTTMGTGKIGGNLLAGTPLDVGYVEPGAASRIPSTSSDGYWRVQARAFTEGQKNNTSRAGAEIEILYNDALNTSEDNFCFVRVTNLDGVVVDLYACAADNLTYLTTTLGIASTNIFTLDTDGLARHASATRSWELEPFPADLDPDFRVQELSISKAFYPQFATLPDGTAITVSPKGDGPFDNEHGYVTFDGYLEGSFIKIRAGYTATDVPFGIGTNTIVSTQTPGIISDGATWFTSMVFPQLLVADNLAITFPQVDVIPPGVEVRVRVLALGLAQLVITNNSGGAYDFPETDFTITKFSAATAKILDLGTIDIDIVAHYAVGDREVTANNLAACINAHPLLQRSITADAVGAGRVRVKSVPVGAEGNGIKLGLRSTYTSILLERVWRVVVPVNNNFGTVTYTTSANLTGGRDIALNAGSGSSQVNLTGLTERLPLGILFSDADFLSENPLGDDASALRTFAGGLRPSQATLPLTRSGAGANRFLGNPGDSLGMADGGILRYAPFTSATPSGSRRFRLYRGGGSVFALNQPDPGAPVDWVADTFPASSTPVLKGAILAAKAFLVRSFKETAFSPPRTTCAGDEVQLIVITYAIAGDGTAQQNGITLAGIINPAGYGEGYAAADRYRIPGKPLYKTTPRTAPRLDNVEVTPVEEGDRSSGKPTGWSQ